MPVKGTITATDVNFRSAPDSSKKDNIIKKLPKGTIVQLVENQGEWLKVKIDGKTGFVSSKFVELEKEIVKGVVTASEVNFRSSPDSSKKENIIKKLSKGTQVQIIEDLGEWFKVTIDGQTGFVSSGFVLKEQVNPPSNGGSTKPIPTTTPTPGPNPLTGIFKFVGNDAVAPDGTKYARKFKLGVFNNGATTIGKFVKDHTQLFTNLAPSNLRIMQAVSENEGKLEAVNTWDNAFMTFGIFQWTAGADGAGELPSVIDRLKKKDAQVFQKYFGQFGLDVAEITTQANVLPRGFFSLNGTTLKTAAQKEKLRTLEWAYRFWLSGQDDTMRQVQIEHAIGRVNLFYRNSNTKVGNRFVADYVTSEFGVALLLDQHVNRPGHVPGTLSKAVDKLIAQLGTNNPATWTDTQERKLLDIYIDLRAGTSMTDSTKRADTIRAAVKAGLASDKRGSYQV